MMEQNGNDVKDLIDKIFDEECEESMNESKKAREAQDKLIAAMDLKTIETIAKKLETASVTLVQNAHLIRHECLLTGSVDALTRMARQLRIDAAKSQVEP